MWKELLHLEEKARQQGVEINAFKKAHEKYLICEEESKRDIRRSQKSLEETTWELLRERQRRSFDDSN